MRKTPIECSNTIDIVQDQSLSPNKTSRPARSLSRRMKDINYDNKFFDNVDNRIRSYLEKNSINHEKALIRLYKLDSLQSNKAKRLLNQINQPTKRIQYSAVQPSKSMLRERNNSLPTGKQMQLELNIIQNELKKINPDINNKLESQTNKNNREYIPPIKHKNFQEGLDLLQQYYSRNEDSLNQLMQIQKDLIQYSFMQK